jgi:alkanesulfonate monooxygenase SsuD/methylene tetrahydromethanopterin reductase-like flavin-dependent oxidoreductase (luciferase family)
MRIGTVILPEHRWSEAAALWRRAEDLGVDTVWTYDHLTWRSLRDGPWFGAVPTLAAAAAVTSRVRLGTLVTSPNFREPVLLAKDVMTLDDISAGRFRLGIGAGGSGFDAEALGGTPWTPAERAGHFAEFVELLDLLLRQPATTWKGSHYAAVEARAVPGSVQQPRVPFTLAATGPRGLALAARFADTWVTFGDPRRAGELTDEECLEVVRRQSAALDGACVAAGRDPATLHRMYLTGSTRERWLDSADAFADYAGRYAQLGISELALHWPRSGEPFAADLATFERVVAAAVSPAA